MILEAIFEHEFHAFSHGFRKNHSPHQALNDLREQCRKLNINWIIDADVSGFFDNLDRSHLRAFIKQRVNDGGILRLIGKWQGAGVIEDGVVHHPETGVVQGSVISPVLANVYLHQVLDDWFVRDVQPRMKGRCFLIRFADGMPVPACHRRTECSGLPSTTAIEDWKSGGNRRFQSVQGHIHQEGGKYSPYKVASFFFQDQLH
jgi:hypothetical protein